MKWIPREVMFRVVLSNTQDGFFIYRLVKCVNVIALIE